MQDFTTILNSDDPVSALRGQDLDHAFYRFALGHQIIESGQNRWEGEYWLLKSAESGYSTALTYFAYQKLELAELMDRLFKCSTAAEATSLLYRETPIQFRDTPSCRAVLQPAIHKIIQWSLQHSKLALAIDALQRVVAGDRSALVVLKDLAHQNQPQARIWAFLLGLSNSLTFESACKLLGPFLNEKWAQRWIGSHFLKQREEEALRWLWAAAGRGDSEANRLLVAVLKGVEVWEDFHYRMLGELLLQESTDAYLLASQHSEHLFSKLHVGYLKKAKENGHDTTISMRHAQSKLISTIIILIASSIACFLTTDLPDWFAVIPPLIGMVLFWRGRSSDIEFLGRFDNADHVALPEDVKIAVQEFELPFESEIMHGNALAWNTEMESWGKHLHQIDHDVLESWGLDSVKRWEEVWSHPLRVPWYEVWANISLESCTLAISGAPMRIKKEAFSVLSSQNQDRQSKLLEDIGYVPLQLCLPHIKKIQGLTMENEIVSN